MIILFFAEAMMTYLLICIFNLGRKKIDYFLMSVFNS